MSDDFETAGPKRKGRKPKVEVIESESSSEAESEDAGEEMLIVGGADELGGYNEQNFENNDEKKKKKEHHFVRKYTQHSIQCNPKESSVRFSN